MKTEPILIVGAGLCGTLLAIRLAQRGHRVQLHEKRPDLRLEDTGAGRSINLALSNRGLRALCMVGLEEAIRPACIPMTGRMVHPLGGAATLSPYSGRVGEHINSVSRSGLNALLLDAAEALPNLELVFNSDCEQVDLKQARATFRDTRTGALLEVRAAAIFGTDGAGSVLRRSMMAQTNALLFNYAQDFLRHGYKELHIPPAENGAFRIEKNALHIWPRGTYMVIALPNLDGSFTVTIFLPFEGAYSFGQLQDTEKIQAFFQHQFPDLLVHMPNLAADFLQNPTGTLGTIKCYPWQAYGNTLLLGDAAHAVVPFYGQGMNASFEDVLVLDGLLDAHGDDWEALFTAFQDIRKKDTDAIADLAVDNFYEMRDHVANPVFMRKRRLETLLEQQFPGYFSKYSLVTFRDDVPYSTAMEKGSKQDAYLMHLCGQSEDTAWDLEAVFAQLQSQ